MGLGWLRPGRKGVRLEKEDINVIGKTLKVIHNYGHSASGVTLHWGCAGTVLELLKECMTEIGQLS